MDLIGMNCCLMKQYIEFVADRLFADLGLAKVGLFSPAVHWMQALRLSFDSVCPSTRCTTRRIHSTSWSPFPWRAKPTSLKNASQNIKDLGSCQAPWTPSSPWMQTSDPKTALGCLLYTYNLFFIAI